MTSKNSISINITTYNRGKKLFRLVESIKKSNFDGLKYEINIINNGTSNLEDKKLIIKTKKIFPEIKIFDINMGYNISAARNFGIKNSNNDIIIFIDDDVVVETNTIKNLIEELKNKNFKSILVPIIYDFKSKNKVWFSGLKHNFWTTLGKFQYDKIKKTRKTDSAVTMLVFDKQILKKLHKFNEKELPIHFEETDFCIRAGKIGIKTFVVANSKIFHDHENAPFITNPTRFYFELRNRFLIANWWSNSSFQIFTATASTVFINIFHLFGRIIIYRKNILESVRLFYKSIKDAIKILKN